MEDCLPTLNERRLSAAEASGGTSCEIVYEKVLEMIKKRNLRGRVLDYGAGIGNLTRRLLDLGRFEQITGADLLPRPKELPTPILWHCLDLNHRDSLSESGQDLLIAAEVIEHLENPREVAREWRRILKPGGTLILSTPNNESIRSLLALAIQGHYAFFGEGSYPAHITALLRKDLERILMEAGFSDIAFTFTNLGGVPKLPGLSWGQISLGLLKGCRFSDNVIVSARA